MLGFIVDHHHRAVPVRCATPLPTLPQSESGARDAWAPPNQMALRRRLTKKFRPESMAFDPVSAGWTARWLHLRCDLHCNIKMSVFARYGISTAHRYFVDMSSDRPGAEELRSLRS
jgi:hypothetical protein